MRQVRRRIACAAIALCLTNAARSAEAHPVTFSKIYWAVNSDTAIHRANLNGSNPEELYRTLGGALDFAADPIEQKLYFSSIGGGGIQKSNLDGTNVEIVVPLTDQAICVAVDSVNRKLYWADLAGGSTLWRANMDGSFREKLLGKASKITAVEVDPPTGYYWADFFTGTTHRTTFDNFETRILLDENSFNDRPLTNGLSVDSNGGFLYAADRVLNAILRVPLDGTSPHMLINTGVVSPEAIAFDPTGQRIYWSNRQRGFGVHTEYDYYVMSANIDGTDVRKEFLALNEWGVRQLVTQMAVIQVPIPEPTSSALTLATWFGSWAMLRATHGYCRRARPMATA